jgi:peptidoglycan/xylan/chitin deacetylase (PgdA/CDA1 family)
MARSVAWMSAVVALTWSASATAATWTFPASADARTEEAHATTNYATSTLGTRGGAGQQVQTMFRFTVSGVSGAVTGAKLRLWVLDGTNDGPVLYTAQGAWTETGVNWNNRPHSAGSAAGNLGAISAGTWVELDAAPLVTGNGTFNLKIWQPSGDLATFDSREGVHAPQLVVTSGSTNPCSGQPDGSICSDGNACTSGDHCLGGTCVSGTPVECDDGNGCTTDACNASGGCTHANGTGPCDLDDDGCTSDACSGGQCVPGAVKVCNDGDTCTTDSCSSATGACVFTPTGDPACNAPPVSGTFIARGAVWRYRDDGVDLGTGWRATGYVDTAWKQGAAELGYGEGDEATVISYGSDASHKRPTAYFRRSFSLAGVPTAPVTLVLERDDGAVVFVNGVEVFRANLPAGTVTYATLASAAVDDAVTDTVSIPASRFTAGTNVVAVEVHQVSATSSDLSFDLELKTGSGGGGGGGGSCVPSEALETKCNGIDDDCDGLTDWLVPMAGNLCTTSGVGACGKGVAACLDGVRTCLTAPAMAETDNGVDDDCNGTIDDVPASASRPLQVRVAVSPTVWNDAPGAADGAAEQLAHAGIAFTSPSAAQKATDWNTAFTQLNSYSMLVLPAYVASGTVTTAQLATLTAWVQAGGVLVVSKPAGAGLLGLCGITSTTTRTDATHVRISATAPATQWLDSLEERNFLLTANASTSPMSLQTYGLASGAVAFGAARGKAGTLGTTFVRRPLGQGAVYSLGFDLLRATAPVCYVNCFDPGRDEYAMLLKAAFRESARGHYALKHSAPGQADGVTLLTHDVDAPDAYHSGAWGGAGAVRMAQMEADKGVPGTYFFTTDYVEGYWSPAVVTQLLGLGMGTAGSHTIQHLDMTTLTMGSCSVTQATYDPSHPTLCGEIAVNLQILDALLPANKPIRSYRAPYLAINPLQFDALDTLGIDYDASIAMGDLRGNFPTSCAREPALQFWFNHRPLYTFPMVQEDGLGAIVNGVETRMELQPANEAQFLTRWKYAALHNARNGAWNVALIHPSYGLGVGPENLATKIDAAGKFLDFLKTQAMALGAFDDFGDFWRGRDEARLTATWTGTGYGGSIKTGAHAAPHLTLEFGDEVGAFSCPGGGPVTVTGSRVMFQQTVPANTTLTFTATVE